MTPDDIKVKASADTEEKVASWIVQQLDIALQDRTQLEARWEKWIKQYEEILPDKKTFPWKNASNVSIPITPIAIETIHAREINTIFSIRPYINVRPKKKGVDRGKCAELERFIDQVFMNILDIYRKGSQWLMEKDKMGNGFLKVYWNYDRKKVRKKSGWQFEEINDVACDVISLEDVIFPVNAKNIQSTYLLAHRIRPHWNALKAKEKLGIYKNVDKIRPFMRTSTADAETGRDITRVKETEAEKMTRTAPEMLKEYTVYEVYFDYDVDDDGYAEQTVMTIHKESATVLRWIYHPYEHGQRPFIDAKYVERTGRVYAKGICEVSEHLQDSINTVYNQTIDNATIANVKCFKGRKTARRDIGEIYPGKTFWLDDPSDLQEFLLGEVHQSSFMIHNLLKDYHERRTKVNDYTAGRESSMLKSRATATGTLALLQESGRHFDLIINNDRQALVELAYQVIELYAQYRPEKVFLVDGGQGRQEEVSLPIGLDNLREEFEFYCAATSMAVNKEIEKQTNLLLIQQLGGIFQQMLNLLMMINNPQIQLPDDIKKFVSGVITAYYKMAEDLVRSFEKIDVKNYLPELPDIVKQAYGQQEGMADMMQKLEGLFGGQGTGAGTSGLEAFQGMAGTGQGVQRTPAGLPE